jgi:hypothetical protein
MKIEILYGFTISKHSEEPTYFYNYQSAVAFARACDWDSSIVEIIFPREGEIDENDILDSPEKIWEKQTREEILNESYRIFKTFNK